MTKEEEQARSDAIIHEWVLKELGYLSATFTSIMAKGCIKINQRMQEAEETMLLQAESSHDPS